MRGDTVLKDIFEGSSKQEDLVVKLLNTIFFFSSRMRFMSHNWSATKQRLHPQSVADIKPPYSFVRGQDSTMWDIVWVSPQGHSSVSVSHHFLLQTPQCLCSVRKRFSGDHCCRGRTKPGCRIVGSHTKWELTTWPDFQLCLHRLLMSTGCKSSNNDFLDVSRSNGGLRISGWIGQLSCLTIFSTSLSVTAFLRRMMNRDNRYLYQNLKEMAMYRRTWRHWYLEPALWQRT